MTTSGAAATTEAVKEGGVMETTEKRKRRNKRRDEGVSQGIRFGEPCALCPHDWGQHAYDAPHKCTMRQECGCVRFTLHAEEGEA